jgi:hypothetical protein
MFNPVGNINKKTMIDEKRQRQEDRSCGALSQKLIHSNKRRQYNETNGDKTEHHRKPFIHVIEPFINGFETLINSLEVLFHRFGEDLDVTAHRPGIGHIFILLGKALRHQGDILGTSKNPHSAWPDY